MLPGEIAEQVSCHGVTSGDAPISRHGSTVQRECRRADHLCWTGKRSRGQRVLGALLGARGRRAPAVSVKQSLENSVRSKSVMFP